MFRKLVIVVVVLMAVGWLHDRYQEARKRKQGVLAIVHIYGPIHTSDAAPSWSMTDADEISHRLHDLSEDKDVKAILLRINTPGGTVGAVQEINEEILRCKSKGIKVVASLGDVAASGGYYLAASADRIVTDPGTITGSIGVILEFGNLEGLFQKVGLKLEVIKSGAHKDIGSPARPLTPEEKQMLQASIDDAYQQFVDAVRTGRHLPSEKVKALADGRIFTGQEAVRIGLADELGNQYDAVRTAIRIAHLPEKPMIVSDQKKSFSSLLSQVSSQINGNVFKAFSDSAWNPRLEYRWR